MENISEKISEEEKITAWNYLKCRAVDAQHYEIAAYYRDGEKNQIKKAGVSNHSLPSVLPLFGNHDKILKWIGKNWSYIHNDFSDISKSFCEDFLKKLHRECVIDSI